MKSKDNSTLKKISELTGHLKTLGFSIVALWRFFEFIGKQTAETENLIENMPGGANINDYRSDIRRKRRDMTRHARIIQAMFSCEYLDEIQRLDEVEEGDLEFIMRSRPTLNNPAQAKTITLTVSCFIDAFMAPEIWGYEKAIAELRQLIKYWRGTLDTHRVSLTLAEMPSYSDDIRQADLFLKIMEMFLRVADTRKKKKKSAAKTR